MLIQTELKNFLELSTPKDKTGRFNDSEKITIFEKVNYQKVIVISIPSYSSSVKYMLTVYNLTGKEVYRSNLSEMENNMHIDLSNGVYVVSLYGNGQLKQTQKWIIVK